MGQTQADLDTAITAVGAGVTAVTAKVQAVTDAVLALVSKITGGATAADLTQEITALQAMASALADDSTKIQAAIDAAKPVTGV